MTPTALALAATAESGPKPGRLVSLDAYRGLIMLFMASGGFGFAQAAKAFPESEAWSWLAFHTTHVSWVGGSAWDMIQPAFMFMVGVAVPYSLARRLRDGQPWRRQFLHALWRSLVLCGLAVFLASKNASRTVLQFTNVLGQIGLGYPFLFLLAGRSRKVQVAALALVAVVSWTAFALYPAPGPDFDFATVGVKGAERDQVVLSGFFAHWSKNSNVAWAFDRWFLNLFPAEQAYCFHPGGYQTLNFVPALITMILGLMVGERLRNDDDARAKLRWMLMLAAGCIGGGLLAGATLCPIVKRIWTPSWALYSGGIVTSLLAALFWIVEIRGWRRWTLPFVVVGMNSIAIYLMHELLAGWIGQTLKVHLGPSLFAGPCGMIWQRCLVLMALWLSCAWLYHRRIFLRI